jgi:hypothetical protein
MCLLSHSPEMGCVTPFIKNLLSQETGVILWLLPSNGSTCYVAPSLRLVTPKSLPAYRHFFFSQGLWPVSPSSRGLVFTMTSLQLLPLLPP